MSHSTATDSPLVTIHRQAKRLAKRLYIPFTISKDVLAKAFYQCSNWSDLEGRLQKLTLERHLQLLTLLPNSDEARAYFSEVRLELARALAQHVLTKSNLASLLEHVQETFIPDTGSISLDDVLPRLDASNWRPAGLGPDPWAVVQCKAVVNGTLLSLVGTRVYWPRSYNFGPERDEHSGEYVEPNSETLRIIWTEPMAWYEAARAYLDDADIEELQLPSVNLTETMALHQAWFENALEQMCPTARYGADDDGLVPVILEGQGCYVVFGYPVGSCAEAGQSGVTAIELASSGDNFSLGVVLHGSPVSLEWIAYNPETKMHPGQHVRRFVALRSEILCNDSAPSTPRKDRHSGLLFVCPMTEFSLRCALEVNLTYADDELVLVSRTNNLTLAREILDRVGCRDLMRRSRNGKTEYFIHMSLPSSEEPPEIALHFDLEGVALHGGWPIISLSSWTRRDEGWDTVLKVDPMLMNLIDSISKKTLNAALAHGLIQRLPIGILEQLEKPPTGCSKIPEIPNEIENRIERLFDSFDLGRVTFSYTSYLWDDR